MLRRIQCIGICLLLGPMGTTAVSQMSEYYLAYRLDGESSGAYFGWSTSRIADVTRDGQDDLVIGAPGWGDGNYPSHVYLVARTLIGGTVLARIDEGVNNMKLGYSVCGLSDVTGDGIPDYAAGALIGGYVIWADGADRTVGCDVPGHPGIVTMASDPGGKYYFGSSVETLSNGQLLEASRPNVAGVGTSAIWYLPPSGGVAQEKLRIQASDHWRVHPAIRNVGDLVGNDGIDDFLIATDDGVLESGYTGSSRGRVSLVSGAISNTGVVLLADIEERHFDGPAEGTVLGDFTYGQHPISTAGDFTGDGVMDFVFTALRPHDWTGATYFYDGATTQMLWELPRPAGVEVLWGMVENVGDVDGDGQDDVAISAEQTGQLGTVFFYSPTSQQYIGSLTGESVNDSFGRSILSLGDLNGDGLGDFGVGAPGADFAATDAGSFYVYLSIPEAGTLALLAIGGLALVRRRKRHALA